MPHQSLDSFTRKVSLESTHAHLLPSFNVKDRAVPQTSNPIFHSCFGRAEMPGKSPIMHCTNTEMAALSPKIYLSQVSPPGILC